MNNTLYCVILNETSESLKMLVSPLQTITVHANDIIETLEGDDYVGDDGLIYHVGRINRYTRTDGTSYLVYLNYDEYDVELVRGAWVEFAKSANHYVKRITDHYLEPVVN